MGQGTEKMLEYKLQTEKTSIKIETITCTHGHNNVHVGGTQSWLLKNTRVLFVCALCVPRLTSS